MLKDQDRIFQNLYNDLGSDLTSAQKRGDWVNTKEITEKGRDWIINEIKDSQLRGRGGAGFPTGLKWSFAPKEVGSRPHYLVINGDESEPGTCKDRDILRFEPHKLIEGCLIASYAIQAHVCYIYIRGEYFVDGQKLQAAIDEAYEKKLIGKNASGTGWDLDIYIHYGAGAYICGEESAMIESIEGKRGLPRHRPPYIAEVGLFGRPTLNHNIETLNWLPEIIENGVDWFKRKGWNEAYSGVRSFSVSGRVKNPGVKIAPAGIPLQQLIVDYCGGMQDGHTLKAFFPGGASGGILPANLASLPLDFGIFEEYGGFIGSHAIVILSDQDNIKEAALNTMRFFKHESCGQCTPCRSGTDKMISLLEDNNKELDLYNKKLIHSIIYCHHEVFRDLIFISSEGFILL